MNAFDILEYYELGKGEIISLIREIVDIESPSRDGDGSRMVADWIEDQVRGTGAENSIDRKLVDDGSHLVIRAFPDIGTVTVLLGHTDTPSQELLLKIVLVFKRRLYMEHLMVAIHSHTFLYMGMVVAIGLAWIAEHWPEGWTNPWWLLMGLSIAWMPVNLFLTQKRVYRQRWWVAPFAFFLIGPLYVCLAVFTAIGALVMSLVNL